MPARTVQKASGLKEKETQNLTLSGQSLISFISGAQTNIGRGTYYNMASEQQQALLDQHAPVLQHARPFYTLMSLPVGVNDVNRQLISWNLIDHTMRETGLRPDEHSPITKWENEIILQSLENMPVTRVFDFFVQLQDKKVTKKRALFLVHEYLKRHKNSWDLWAVKYRTDFKRVLRHAHTQKDADLLKVWRYLKYGEADGCGQLIHDYEAVRNGDQDKLAKLPSSVAEGFMTKFGISKEDFWKMFQQKGGKFTAKEKRTKAQSLKKVNVDTGFDMEKAKLFDLLVYLRACDRLPKPVQVIKKLLKAKAKKIAEGLSFELENVGLILDTSKSMVGTKDQPFHPMLRGMAISLVLEQVSKKFKEYRTNKSASLFPKLTDQSNYADAVLQALKDGKTTIIIVGDGYENAPYEGALHALLFAYKKKADKKNKLMVLHFNPVFASETLDVRPITEMASYVGIRDVEGMNESMFLAIAKQQPMLAVQNTSSTWLICRAIEQRN